MPFDWFRRRGDDSASSPSWSVRLEDGQVVAEDGLRASYRIPLDGARNVRIVPLSAGSHHAQASGWQVALGRPDGDLLLGMPFPDWRIAREVARLVCERTALPLDDLTERLFSRVGM